MVTNTTRDGTRETTPSRAPHATSDSSRPPSRSLMLCCPGVLLCIAQPPQLAEPAKFEPCPGSPLASRAVCRWPSAPASRVPVVIGGRWRPRAMCGSWHMPPVIRIGWNGDRMSLRRANYYLTRTPIAYLAYEWGYAALADSTRMPKVTSHCTVHRQPQPHLQLKYNRRCTIQMR